MNPHTRRGRRRPGPRFYEPADLAAEELRHIIDALEARGLAREAAGDHAGAAEAFEESDRLYATLRTLTDHRR